MENKRIYGIDPGSLTNTDEIDNLSEIDLYLYIYGLGDYIWKSHIDIGNKKLPNIKLEEETYALEYMINQTKKFGVELPEPIEGKHLTITSSYIDWYTYYTKHFIEDMSEEDFSDFMTKRKKGLNVEEYLPKELWSERNKGKALKKVI